MEGTQDILAIVLGGLGKSQMADVRATLAEQPRVLVPEVTWFNSYAADIPAIVAAYPGVRHVALIGHSFAAIPMLEAAAEPWCRYLALIDPVSNRPFVGSWDLPARPLAFDWFRREPVGVTFGIWEVPLEIRGAVAPQCVPADPALAGTWDLHNELPHQPALIARILSRLLAACAPVPSSAVP